MHEGTDVICHKFWRTYFCLLSTVLIGIKPCFFNRLQVGNLLQLWDSIFLKGARFEASSAS